MPGLPGFCGRGLPPAAPSEAEGCLSAGFASEVRQDLADVVLHRLLRHMEFPADLPVGPTVA